MHAYTHCTYRGRSCEKLLLQRVFFFWISYLTAWRKFTSILRTCGVPVCHSNEGSFARWRNWLCSRTAPGYLTLSVWIYIKRASVQHTVAVCMDLRQDEEMHGATHRSLLTWFNQLPPNCECYTLQQRGLCHFPHSTMRLLSPNGLQIQNLWMFSHSIIKKRRKKRENNRSIWEWNEEACPQKTSAVCGGSRHVKSLDWLDHCLGFAGWAAVKVASCVTKAGFTLSTNCVF